MVNFISFLPFYDLARKNFIIQEMIIETGTWLIRESRKAIRRIGSKPTAKQRLQAAHLKARLGQWRRDFGRIIELQ